MPKISEQSVREVKERVSLVDVVSRVVTLRKRGASLVGLCPFHQEKSGSFHVNERKGFFKCFGCGVGGDALAFVMKNEGLDFPEAIEALAKRGGILLHYDEPKKAVAAQGNAPVFAMPEGVTESQLRRAVKSIARRDAERIAAERHEKARDEALRPKVERRPVENWPREVVERFDDGIAALKKDEQVASLARQRGWPEAWVWWLVEAGLVSLPLLPWRESDRDAEARGVAFRVDVPEVRESDARVVCEGLRSVGYHQRAIIRGEKNWLYVPYSPAVVDEVGKAKWLSEYQRALVKIAQTRNAAPGEGMLQGTPFVLGVLSGVRRLIISEGQWDAITFAGACGWLDGDESWPSDACVMGARGANGVDVLLAWWGGWLATARPEVLVLADNDEAGKRWDEPEPVELGEQPWPTFAEKLLAAGARRVEVTRVKRELGKDFNDYWRARQPSQEAMAAWLARLGF